MRMTRLGPVIDGVSAERAEGSGHPGSSRGRVFAGILLIGYVVGLCVLGVSGYGRTPLRGVPSFALQDLRQPLDWAAVVAVEGLMEAAEFAVIGCLVALAFGRPADGRSWIASNGQRILLLLTGVGLSAVVYGVRWGQPAGPLPLLPPLTGFVLGAWIGSAWLRGYGAVLWLAPKLGLILLLLAGCVGGLVFLCLDDTPLAFEAPRVTSDEKRRLLEALKGKSEHGNPTQQLRLSQNDVNSLLRIAMSQAPFDGKTKVILERGGFAAELSLETPLSSPGFRYVNLQGTCRMEVTSGRLSVEPERLRVGRVRVPKLVQDACLPLLVAMFLEDPDIAKGVALIDSLRLTPSAGELVYQSRGYGRNNLHSILAKLCPNPDARMETEIYIRHLVDAASTLPQGERRFEGFVQTAFEFARKRSLVADPVLENRGAILALAILLGHRRMEMLVGPVTDPDLQMRARRSVGQVTIHGRPDWTKHFFVSAGLTLLSNHGVSDGAGLFKEESDAGAGGSGFSFGDLLADRAGTEFAQAATRDADSARKLQERLSSVCLVGDIFPDPGGLPEGISDAELQSVYGGVGGERYGKMVAEIERRLAKCAALGG